jgi:hypothetical protein
VRTRRDAEVIDVVHDADAALQADEVLGRGDDVGALEDALLELNLEAKLLVDLVAADAAEVVALRIEEQALEQGLGVRRGRRLARAEALVDLLQRFLLVAGRILLQRADDRALVDRRVDHAQGRDVVLLERANDRLRQRLEGPGEHDALLGIDRVFDEHERGHVFHVQRLGNLEVLDLVEKVQEIDVARVADRSEHRRDQELPATPTAVEIDVQQVVVVELHFQPGAAVRDDAERVQRLAIRVRCHLEGDAGGAMELGHHDTLGAVDDERAALGHHRDFTHVNVLVLDEVLLAEAKLHVERHRVGDALAEALELGVLRVAEIVGNVLERQPLVIAQDREHLAEHGLEALGLALLLGNALLQEVEIGRDLNLDEVRRLDDFAKLAEVDAFRVCAVGHESSQ